MRGPRGRVGLAAALGLVVLAAGLAYAQWRDRAGEPLGLDDVRGALQAAEFTVEGGSEVPAEPFGVAGHVLLVNGQPVQVCVFPSAAAREKVRFSDDGTSVTVEGRPVMITWIAPPRIVEAKNLLITVVLPDADLAEGIVQALQGLGGGN